jgi:glycosyltransferase involved in cell wall biosynthesis
MPRVLVLTTDLPYFPGRNGHDFFNLRFLAQHDRVSVVAPMYDWQPREGVRNLASFLDTSIGWNEPPQLDAIAALPAAEASLRRPFARLPARVRVAALRTLLGLWGRPRDTYEKLAILACCAPRLLHAIQHARFDAFVLIQTSLEPWLDYLPAGGGKLVYFHDVRSDYLARSHAPSGRGAPSALEIRAIRRQEQSVARRADVVAFVSELDLQRAQRLFDIRAQAGVAPIPVDTQYFAPAPPGWRADGHSIVLFSGHLSHPPNVDAVLHFLREIWPRIRAGLPAAVFQVVGMLPAPELVEAVRGAPGCELHANVPDIRPYFWNAGVYVVPMRFGGGVRQKILEAWSMRVPVVCTTMAAEGIAVRNGEHCTLADDPQEFAQRVVDSLRQRAQSAAMVSSASAYVEASNSISAAAPRFAGLVARAVEAGRRRPYRLLFDLRWMHIGEAGGIEQCTYELISAIAQIDRRNAFRLWAPRSSCSEWRLPPRFQARMHHSDARERGWDACVASLANALARSLGRIPVRTDAMRSLATYHDLDFDLVHSICGYTQPDLLGFPGILTIHDLQHLHFPEFFRPDKLQEREQLYRNSARHARHILCVSEFTRQDVHRRYGIPLEKMTTVWNIPSRIVWEPIEPRRRRALVSAMGIAGPFFLYPAHCWPHKNHVALVEAFDAAAADLPPGTMLLLTGREFPADHPAAELIRKRNLGGRIRHLGFRSPLEIRALFQDCLALVYPSLFEGFGIPVAEAIIAGRPVLCSNTTSLPEVAGEAMLGFDPRSPAQIAAALLAVARDPELRATLSEAALRRRAVFASRPRAVETLAVYQRVFEEFRGCP